MNLWGHDLLQQWKTQINIPPTSETNHKIKNVSEKNIKRHYQEQSQTVQAGQKQGTRAAERHWTVEKVKLNQLRDTGQ